MTKFQLHCQTWKDGCGADICSMVDRIVLARGKIPCDVLLIGEAPGEAENVLGTPFVGPAGKLLDHVMDRALNGRQLRLAFTNIVGCIPREEDRKKAVEPDPDSIVKCQPRLTEFIQLASPKLVIMVGKLSTEWLSGKWKDSLSLKEFGIKGVSIDHPAFILRSHVAGQGLLVQKAIVTVSNALDELEEAC